MSNSRIARSAIAMLLLAACHLSARAQAPEARDTVVWSRTPIHVALAVDEQRLVTFPGPVLFGHLPALQGKLEVQNVKDTVYLTATQPFAPTQAIVKACVMRSGTCTPEGEVYLLAIGAGEGKPGGRPLFVEHVSADTPLTSQSSAPPPPDPVALVRHAAQQLYAPSRLLREHADTSRIPVAREAVPHLYTGGAFDARPLAAWSDGRHYVTALELRNTTPVPQPVDVRAIRGRWLSRTLVAGMALTPPRGTAGNHTTVFLLSPVPFDEATAWPR